MRRPSLRLRSVHPLAWFVVLLCFASAFAQAAASDSSPLVRLLAGASAGATALLTFALVPERPTEMRPAARRPVGNGDTGPAAIYRVSAGEARENPATLYGRPRLPPRDVVTPGQLWRSGSIGKAYLLAGATVIVLTVTVAVLNAPYGGWDSSHVKLYVFSALLVSSLPIVCLICRGGRSLLAALVAVVGGAAAALADRALLVDTRVSWSFAMSLMAMAWLIVHGWQTRQCLVAIVTGLAWWAGSFIADGIALGLSYLGGLGHVPLLTPFFAMASDVAIGTLAFPLSLLCIRASSWTLARLDDGVANTPFFVRVRLFPPAV